MYSRTETYTSKKHKQTRHDESRWGKKNRERERDKKREREERERREREERQQKKDE